MSKLVIACTARTLFDLDESHQVFLREGVEAYSRYQIANEERVLAPGVAYPLVRKLLNLNTDSRRLVEVILLSRNSADTGLRVFNSIKAHNLDITRAAFTRGASPIPYISAFNVDLFLSSEPEIVAHVLGEGHAAATVLPSHCSNSSDSLKIAFDGDAVIFSDDAERIFKEQGLAAFTEHETSKAREPLLGGPFKRFLSALHEIQSAYDPETSPIRTALVTARGAPAHERVIRTLREWNIRIDESFFLGGLDKGSILKAFGADIFFDDQLTHCDSARRHVPTGHVPHGIAQVAVPKSQQESTPLVAVK